MAAASAVRVYKAEDWTVISIMWRYRCQELILKVVERYISAPIINVARTLVAAVVQRLLPYKMLNCRIR